jgi:hypothetical protein
MPPLEPAEAARRVLAEAGGEALHWTVVWDRALRAGYIDPISQPDARDRVVRWLAEAARSGEIERTSTGTYRARPGADGSPV